MKYQLEKATRLGNRVVNEDRIGVAECEEAVMMVVADGMGGYRGGQIASKALVNRMLQQFKRRQFPVENPQALLKEMIADAHLAVIVAGGEQYPPIEPRTTCVVCLIQEGMAWWAHVGDSRLYWFREGKVQERTIDHSKIEEMRRKGELSAKDMEKHPKRHQVTRCIGFQKHPPVPTISKGVELAEQDMLLLCSDGVWGAVDEELMIKSLTGQPIDKAVEGIAYQAEFRAYPSSDNISVVVLKWISGEVEEKKSDQEITSADTTISQDQEMQSEEELNNVVGKA